jgi:hypothetical protein
MIKLNGFLGPNHPHVRNTGLAAIGLAAWLQRRADRDARSAQHRDSFLDEGEEGRRPQSCPYCRDRHTGR